jgi:50S ribosome-binding GTPase
MRTQMLANCCLTSTVLFNVSCELFTLYTTSQTVGKSSLLNTLLGKRKVSVSPTPGHTKHIQTHYVTQQLVLCDCPGVVHPKLHIPKAMQVVFGLYPIAQVREPFSNVRFVAENCWPRLDKSLKLHHIASKVRYYHIGRTSYSYYVYVYAYEYTVSCIVVVCA